MEPVPVPIATAPEGPLAEGEWFLRVEEPVRRGTTPRTSVPAPSVTDPPSDEDAPPRRTTRATAGRHPNRYHLPQPVGSNAIGATNSQLPAPSTRVFRPWQ
uniref:Uncharacterized protein n=1 Tax=Knipowitschia caucasica TaxID=637954 RepID=A0AAV2LCD1_KNICA